jgi:hypothetical protein
MRPSAIISRMAADCQPYDEVSSDELGERAAREMSYRFEPADEPEDVVITGPCPRCQGSMTYTWPMLVVRQTVAREAQDALEITVICRCRAEHRGADREAGCGAYWTLWVPRPA